MPSLDDLKKRITSVKSTQKITKAMKMVAAAKLRKAQENAEKGRPYSEKMNNIVLNLSSSITDCRNSYEKKGFSIAKIRAYHTKTYTLDPLLHANFLYNSLCRTTRGIFILSILACIKNG